VEKTSMAHNLLLVSNSTLYGSGYLDHCESQIRDVLEKRETVLFVPYARPSGMTWDEYTNLAHKRFEKMGFRLQGIQEWTDPKTAVESSEAIFIGGGNTFVLLKSLYDSEIMDQIKEKVNAGTPYIGTSAGSNVAGITIKTTNDMPIVYPPSFDAMGLVPFDINPHYIDPDLHSTHKGETRETRIKEFHAAVDEEGKPINLYPVVGLREGAMLHVVGDKLHLKGSTAARIFRRKEEPREHQPGESLDFLLSNTV